MAITTPLMDEILQHFARIFPMPGRIDGREDYLALVKTWSDQLEPYTDEQVKEACRRLMGKLKRFPYPSDVRDELAPVSAASTTVLSLSVEVDTSSIDVAQAKAEKLRGDLADALAVMDRAMKAELLDPSCLKDRSKVVDALCVLAQNGFNPGALTEIERELSAAVQAARSRATTSVPSGA